MQANYRPCSVSWITLICLWLMLQVSFGDASALITEERGLGSSPLQVRDRVRLRSGWKFWRSETIPDNLVYERRPDANGVHLKELKPWILPSANDFIDDISSHHPRPSDQPDINITYVSRAFDDSTWKEVNVPHDWAIELPFLTENRPITPTTMGLLPVHGVGWYRHTLDVSHDDLEKIIYLDIDGGMSYPMVWVNEQLVGGWPFGYNSFRLNISPYLEVGKHNQIAIRCENPRGRSSRWYPGGGLYRNVWLTKVDQVHVSQWGTLVTSRDVSAQSATVDLTVSISNKGAKDRQVTILTEVYELEGKTQHRYGRRVDTFPPESLMIQASGSGKVSGSMKIKNPRLWGPLPSQYPHMHVAVTRVFASNKLLDSYETRFGIRSLRFDAEEGVFVNDEPVHLQGVNQHHDLGALGAAFNERAATRQLETLQEMGVNGIRMAHNPPAPELLDLTDRMGFLVINEIFDCWREAKTPYDFHLIFDDWWEPDLRSLLRRDRNHPSVMMWSYGNEVKEQDGSDEKAAEISRNLHDIVAQEDPTRPSTASLHFSTANSSLAKTLDVMSLNYQGEGMRYGPAYEHLTQGNIKSPQYDNFHEAFPDRLIVGSEVASSVSLRGAFIFPVTPYNSAPVNDSSGGDRTSLAISAYELYTAEAGSSPDRVFLTQDEHPFVSGGFVWTGWDYLGEPYHYSQSRSSYFGIIDLAGFKKERFWLYQSRWRPDMRMAHISPHWNWPDRAGEITPVHVFTSADEAELFLNDKSLGRQERAPLTYRFRWDNVTYEPGELRVVTYKNGRKWAKDSVRTTGEAVALRLKADRAMIAADDEDISFVTVEVVDDEGNVVPDADNAIAFSISGPGKIVATDNGYPNDRTAFTSHERKAFNGLLLAIIRAQSGSGGTITVEAKSEGLDSAELTLRAK